MVELRPGIWFVYREGFSRWAGSYPVTRPGRWLVLGFSGLVCLVLIGGIAALLRFGDEQSDGGWIAALCATIFVLALCVHPVIRRHTDYSITLAEWRHAAPVSAACRHISAANRRTARRGRGRNSRNRPGRLPAIGTCRRQHSTSRCRAPSGGCAAWGGRAGHPPSGRRHG